MDGEKPDLRHDERKDTFWARHIRKGAEDFYALYGGKISRTELEGEDVAMKAGRVKEETRP